MPLNKSFSKAKRPASSLSLTSLMDVLTIILIFLLVNYSNISDDEGIPKFVTLPVIKTLSGPTTQDPKHKVISIAVGKNQILVNQEVIKFRRVDPNRIIKKTVKLIKKHKSTDPKKITVITVKADKDVTYNLLDTILVSGAYVGITQIGFLTLDKDKQAPKK